MTTLMTTLRPTMMILRMSRSTRAKKYFWRKLFKFHQHNDRQCTASALCARHSSAVPDTMAFHTVSRATRGLLGSLVAAERGARLKWSRAIAASPAHVHVRCLSQHATDHMERTASSPRSGVSVYSSARCQHTWHTLCTVCWCCQRVGTDAGICVCVAACQSVCDASLVQLQPISPTVRHAIIQVHDDAFRFSPGQVRVCVCVCVCLGGEAVGCILLSFLSWA